MAKAKEPVTSISKTNLESAGFDTKVTYGDIIEMIVSERIESIISEGKSLSDRARELFDRVRSEYPKLAVNHPTIKKILLKNSIIIPEDVDISYSDRGTKSVDIYYIRASNERLETSSRGYSYSASISGISFSYRLGDISFRVDIPLTNVKLTLPSALVNELKSLSKDSKEFKLKYGDDSGRITFDIRAITRQVKAEFTKKFVQNDAALKDTIEKTFKVKL